jgi:hypothetical protein
MLVADRFPQIEFTRPTFIQAVTKEIGEECLEFEGEVIIRMNDYGMKPPTSLLGFAGTKNKMRLRFLFWAERVKADVLAAS